ncbi:protein of unknown function [Burkholderia multivorans]
MTRRRPRPPRRPMQCRGRRTGTEHGGGRLASEQAIVIRALSYHLHEVTLIRVPARRRKIRIEYTRGINTRLRRVTPVTLSPPSIPSPPPSTPSHRDAIPDYLTHTGECISDRYPVRRFNVRNISLRAQSQSNPKIVPVL